MRYCRRGNAPRTMELLKHGDGLPIEAQQRATNGRPYNIACTTDNAVGASIARPLVMVLSAFS